MIRPSLACVALVLSIGATSPALAQVQRPASTSEPSFSRLFESTIGDFRRLPSKDSLTWLIIGSTAAAAGKTKDWDITSGFSESRRMSGMFKAGETIGGARAQLGGALVTYTVGRLIKQPKIARVGADLIRAQILAQTITGSIKHAVRRNRPDGGEFSFPSGHTSVTFATATVLQRHFGWKAGLPSYAVAAYVAASRVHVKRHFASDVAFGAALGIVAGRTVTIGRGPARFAVSPMMSANAAGVSFALVNNR